MPLQPTVASSGAGTLSRSLWPRAAACSGTHTISHAAGANVITLLTEAQQESKVVDFACIYSESFAQLTHVADAQQGTRRQGSCLALLLCMALLS